MEAARLSRSEWRRQDFPDQGGDGATFQTEVGYGATLAIRDATAQTMVHAARLSRPRRRWRDQESIPRNKGGNDATFETKAETAQHYRPRWRRRDFLDQHGDGATFKKGFQGFRDQGGYGATQETARLKKQRREQPGHWDQKVPFQDFRDQGGDGATFQTKAETARLRNNSLRPWWIRRDFRNQR